MLKTTTTILFLLFLNGCIQGTAFLGPVLTGASTGSVYQAGLSFGSSQAITKITGKTPTENVKSFLSHAEGEEKKNAKNFFKVVESIKESSGIKNLAIQ